MIKNYAFINNFLKCSKSKYHSNNKNLKYTYEIFNQKLNILIYL